MFLVTSVTTLRERTSGTLERLLAMPMGKLDFLVGYAARVRRSSPPSSRRSPSALCVWVLDLDVAGPVWLLLVVAVVDAVLGTALGLFVSAFARTEFQAVQFMPALVIPQLLLCGLFVAARRAAARARGDLATCCRCPTPSTRCSTWPTTHGHRRGRGATSALVAALRRGRPRPRRPHPAPPDRLSGVGLVSVRADGVGRDRPGPGMEECPCFGNRC